MYLNTALNWKVWICLEKKKDCQKWQVGRTLMYTIQNIGLTVLKYQNCSIFNPHIASSAKTCHFLPHFLCLPVNKPLFHANLLPAYKFCFKFLFLARSLLVLSRWDEQDASQSIQMALYSVIQLSYKSDSIIFWVVIDSTPILIFFYNL